MVESLIRLRPVPLLEKRTEELSLPFELLQERGDLVGPVMLHIVPDTVDDMHRRVRE
jgi:hypothetical protein